MHIEKTKKLRGELELAKKIQTVLLPEKPEIQGYEISAYMMLYTDGITEAWDKNRDFECNGELHNHRRYHRRFNKTTWLTLLPAMREGRSVFLSCDRRTNCTPVSR